MINKLRFFGGELKHSLLFVLIVTFQVAISIFLLNLSLTMAYNSTVETKYYSKAVADKSFVFFNAGSYYGKSTVGELSKLTDLKNLATTAKIGEVEHTYIDEKGEEQKSRIDIGIATPALMNNFHTFSTKIAQGNSKGYYEAQLLGYSSVYKVGEMYENNIHKDDGTIEKIKFKIVSSAGYHDYFYNFDRANVTGQVIHPYVPFQIIISDDLLNYDYAELNAGIFMGDLPTSHYESFGFVAKSVKQIYDEFKQANKESSKAYTYLAIVIIMFTFVSTFCLYMIDVYKADRKRAVNYICGVTSKSQLIIETIKMVFVFAVALVPNVILSIFLGTKEMYNTMDGNMVTVPYAIASTAIMLGVYSLAISVGMIKYIKTKPIKIINNVH